MPTAAELINEIITNAINTANEQTEASKDAADALIAKQAGFFLTPPSSNAGFTVAAEEPDIPTVEDSRIRYDSELDKLVALLSDQLAGFFADYYPLASDAFDEATAWLVNEITNGGTGVNSDVADAVWQRSRENRIAEGRRVQAQAVAGFAAKGHFIYPGALADITRQNLYEQAGNAGIAATTISFEQYKIEVESVKFAVQMAINSRSMAMNAAADYIRGIASAPDAAVRVASLDSDAQARMVSAYSQWYNTRLERDRIVLSSKLAEMSSRDDIYKHRRTNATQNDQVEVQALTAAADAYARAAAAALSSINSVVSNTVAAFG